MIDPLQSLCQALAVRERFRDAYFENRDPIADDRLHWRAQTFRHLVHLLPGQSILELGCGSGRFTRQLSRVSRDENPITSVGFNISDVRPQNIGEKVEFISMPRLMESIGKRHFKFIVGIDMMDRTEMAALLKICHGFLEPGGEIIFYESNPWNPILKIRRFVSLLFGREDSRELPSRPELYEIISEVEFVKIFCVFNDFVFAPLTKNLTWLLRNFSIFMENLPVCRSFAGSIVIHAQKPPAKTEHVSRSLCEHSVLFNRVSVVVPCHNEEMNVEPLVSRLNAFYGDYLREIVLVDDNSNDRTRIIIQALAETNAKVKTVIRKPPNGVGRAIVDGYKAATGDYILSMDSDFQHLLPEIRELFDEAAKGHKVIIGSRFSRHSVLLNYPFMKIVANRAFHTIARIVLAVRFRDVTNNLKLIHRDVVNRLILTQPGFAVNAEIGLQPLALGLEIKEVPISWVNRSFEMGTSSFKLAKVGSGYFQVLFHLGLRRYFGIGRYQKLAKVKPHE